MTQPTNRGLLYEPIVDGKDGVLGSSVSYAGGNIIMADGQWDMPIEHERQFNEDFDTNSCVSFGLNNQEELYLLGRYGVKVNHSDRALAKMSDTQPNGNTPQKVYEARRKKGFLFESEWPWTSDIKSWGDYMKEIPQKLLTLAIGHGAEWDFWHDYVRTDSASLKEALRYSPVAVGVALMPSEDGTYYRPEGWNDTHWAVVRGDYEDGDWKLYDTYPPFEKRIKAGYKFNNVGKVIRVEKQVINETAWNKFIKLLRELLGI